MLRRHFMTKSPIKANVIIKYIAKEHVKFFGGLAKKGMNNFNERIIVINDVYANGEGVWELLLENKNRLDDTYFFDDESHCQGYPNNYTYLIGDAPYYESNLNISSITIPNGVKELINSFIYIDTSSIIKEFILPETLESLYGDFLIGATNIEKIIIPKNVVRVGKLIDLKIINSNFKLKEILIYSSIPVLDTHNGTIEPPLGKYDNNDIDIKIRVYADCINEYKNDAIWGQYSDLYDTINTAIIYIDGEGVRQFYEFYGTDIEETYEGIIEDVSTQVIYLPNSVTEIWHHSFVDLTNLTEIHIPNTVTFIGLSALPFASDIVIFFDGTKAEWETIEKDPYWLNNANVLIVCKDGEIDL